MTFEISRVDYIRLLSIFGITLKQKCCRISNYYRDCFITMQLTKENQGVTKRSNFKYPDHIQVVLWMSDLKRLSTHMTTKPRGQLSHANLTTVQYHTTGYWSLRWNKWWLHMEWKTNFRKAVKPQTNKQRFWHKWDSLICR